MDFLLTLNVEPQSIIYSIHYSEHACDDFQWHLAPSPPLSLSLWQRWQSLQDMKISHLSSKQATLAGLRWPVIVKEAVEWTVTVIQFRVWFLLVTEFSTCHHITLIQAFSSSWFKILLITFMRHVIVWNVVPKSKIKAKDARALFHSVFVLFCSR